jgi:hypothetical protein
MITVNVPSTIGFNVQVHGTSADAEARLVLTANDVGYVFKARKVAPSTFEATICVPSCVKPGDYPMAVEVMVNGRLFTPLRKTVTVEADTVAVEVPALQIVHVPAPSHEQFALPDSPAVEAVAEDPVEAPKVEPIEAPKVEHVEPAPVEVAPPPAPAPKPKSVAKPSLLKIFSNENPPPVIEVVQEVEEIIPKVSVPLIRLLKDKVIFEE